MPREYQTLDEASQNWVPAKATRIQQARKTERDRIAKEIQLAKIQKHLEKLKTSCSHEITYTTPGITADTRHCIICGTVLS
jgi:hypothetical protein